MSPIKIDIKMLPMKGHYFLFNAGTAPLLLFGPTIAKQLGYSAITVGSMYTVLPLVALVSKPSVCAVADKFKLRRACFILTLIICLLSIIILKFVPPRQIENGVELRCHQEVHIVNCNEVIQNSVYPLEQINGRNESFKCELSCKGTSEYVSSMCKTWKVNKYCYKNVTPNVIHDTSQKKTSNIVQFGKTAVEKSKSDFFVSPNVPRNFSFTAVLQSPHVFQMRNCMYGRVLKAEFPDTNKSYTPYCSGAATIGTACELNCKNTALMETFHPENKDVMLHYEFWLLFVVFILNWASVAVNTSISDTLCFELLGVESHKYGYTRLFGSLGWGFSSIMCGLLTDYFSEGREEKNYTPLFALSSVLMILDIFAALAVKVEQKSFSLSICRDVGKLFTDARIVAFTLCCFYVGLCSALIWQFLFWHLENISSLEDLKWSKTVQGLDALFATILGELPFFFLSGMFIKKLGHTKSMSLVLFVLSLRLFLYSTLSRPIWVLPIELTNGFTFGIFYATMASYAYVVASPGTEATTQGVFGSAFDGLGVSAGSFVGGYIFEKCGGSFMYATFALLTFVAFLLHMFIQRCVESRPSSYSIPGKDLNSSVHYTTPTEATMMLEERS